MEIKDKVFFVNSGRNQVEIECPDCAGKRAHHIVLGNGDEHDIACDTCSRGYLGSTGMAQVWENSAAVKHGYVQTMTMGINGPEELTLSVYYEGRVPEESGFSDRHFKIDEVYLDESVAQVVADRITAKQQERFIKDKKERNKSWSWHVTYHRRKIRDAQRDIEYSTEQLAYAQSKAKK